MGVGAHNDALGASIKDSSLSSASVQNWAGSARNDATRPPDMSSSLTDGMRFSAESDTPRDNLAVAISSAALHFSPDLTSALRLLSNGINPANDPPAFYAALQLAISDSPPQCSDLLFLDTYSFSLCAEDANVVVWTNEASPEDPPQHAEASPTLDALLAPSGNAPIWMRVPSAAARQVATAHYLSTNATACDGEAPYVIRIHYYCGERSSPSLRQLTRYRYNGIDAPWRPSDTTDGEMRCELEGFAELPSLCVAPFNDPAIGRLDDLIKSTYSGRRSHGFTSKAGGAGGYGNDPTGYGKALTYGELSVVGMLQLIDALGHARETLEGGLSSSSEATTVGTRHQLRPSDLLLDIGSGVGKLILATGVLTEARGVGVEVEPERAERASAALRDALESGRISSSEATRLSLGEGDATIRGVLPQDATLAYFSNLCFGEELTARIVERIIELPQLQCIGALRELLMSADREDVKCRLVQKRTIRVSTTWDENARLFIYCCE